MITRFRVEAKGESREIVQELLGQAALRMIETFDQPGEWECTAEVIIGSINKFQGRMVFVYHDQS